MISMPNSPTSFETVTRCNLKQFGYKSHKYHKQCDDKNRKSLKVATFQVLPLDTSYPANRTRIITAEDENSNAIKYKAADITTKYLY
ncbi:hypothetical protein AGMMS49936_06400 [Endomicrobiia bacterium]|nr:hypothetical protein AGMMS49936_06400 [Endomicrobiia bacterium]